ncbi:P-loop containing nucleoside triphosphate hydrolase protein, partial [Phyllosticta citribraziliensis]
MDLPSGDPWDWSIDQVVEALCTKTNWWQGAFPNSSLPEPGSLEVALRENETNGFTLLSYVDDRILKSDFGLKAVARRAAVRCAIGWLRNQSSKYADYMSSQKSLAHGESLAEHNVAKQNCESNRFDSLMQEEDPTPLTAAALARHDKLERIHDRPRETQIVDARGKKRRRLVLNDANKEPQDLTTFDFNKKLTVDQLFYGATDFGGLLGDDKNFSISQMSNPHPVAAQYVNRQFIYFINKSKRESVGDSRQAVAVYPYKEQFEPENQPRSATLFRITGNQVQASREDASHLHVASKNRRLPNAPNGFSDVKDDEDGVLPVYGDSDEEDGYSPSLLEEMEADRQEDEALGLSKHLTKEKVLSIIEDRVQEFVGLWKAKKLPLRERTARAVWRKPKRRSDRILLVMEARRVIAHVSRRLEKLKEALLADPWSSEGDIRKQCAVLEESVIEIEEQSWRASVWERAAEPPPPVGKTVAKRTPAARKKPRIPPVGDEAGDLVNSESELEADSDGLDDFISDDEEMAGWCSLPNQQPASPLRLPSGDSVLNVGDDDASMGEADDAMDVDPTQEGDEMSDIQETIPVNQGRVSSERRTWAAKSVPGGQSPPRSEPSTVVDLTRTSPVASPSPVDAETPFSQRVKTNGLSSHFTTLTEEDLAELTQDQVSGWDTQKLEERGDRKRLLVQMIRLYLSEHQLKIMKGDTTMTPAEWQRLVWGSIKKIAQKQRDKGASEKDWLAAQQYVKLYTCWVTGRASFWMNPVLQAAQFLDQLGDYSDEARKNTHACWKFLRSVLAATPDDCAGIANSRKRAVQKDSHGAVLRQDARERQKVQAQNEWLYEQRMTSLQPSSTSGIPINIGKRDDQGDICIPPHIATRIKPHQTSGIRFMWRELIEAGQGCLLAHTMGLGKTMQAITFLVAITQAALSSDDRVSSQIPEHLQNPRYLIICPASLITNWLNELKLWIPPDWSYMIGDIRSIESDTPRGDRGRLIQLWNGTGGILVIGYEMFVSLVKPAAKSATTSTDQETKCAHLLLESPSLIIADEAHRIKSATSIARKFFEKFTSPSRIALTGSPLANNLEEYWSMIDWVAPGYLGTPNEFKAYFVEPIQEGFYKESTRSDHRRALKCLTVLKREIEPKVNRADITVLKDELKSKIEFLIMVPLSKVQEDAYKTCVSHMWDTDVAEVSNARLWHWMHILTVLCNHPLAFRKRIKEKERAAGGADARKKKGKPVFEDEPEVEDDTETPAKTLSPALIADIEKLFNNTPHVGSPLWSYKTELLVRIIQNARDAGDKVLVFSQSIPTLDYLEMFLTHTSTISCVRLDGSTKMSERPKLLNQFNMGKFDAFLMSTRAGGIGFNLPAANRVVLFDYGFNPQHEEQAIGRAYRIGQQKEVFVYRFVVGGTFEPKVWNKALFKAQLASRVVDAKNPERRAEKMKDYLFPPEFVPQEDLSENRGKDPSVLDKLLDDMDAGKDLGIRAITTTETLMAEDKDADLDVTEMEEVELMMRKDGGVRKDNPATFGRMLEIQEQQ